ncbi:MAG: hypothetical protein K2N88_02870 [Muribaculaceae bacterium]|nr:hypothetical protein [Muribaculaceae bacterium]
MTKTTVFNLIILDESGSMYSSLNSTIAGCNETIQVAKNLQKQYEEKQNSFISIYSFSSGGSRPSRYLCKNVPVNTQREITPEDYDPDGCTPMLDAIGSTLVDLMAVAKTHEDAMGIVTIITDGYENSSTQYDYEKVRRLISQARELGWKVNFIGANIDVDAVSDRLNISSVMAYNSTETGTRDMFKDFKRALIRENASRIEQEANMDHNERLALRKKSQMLRSRNSNRRDNDAANNPDFENW